MLNAAIAAAVVILVDSGALSRVQDELCDRVVGSGASLGLFDVTSDRTLPFHLRIFALRLLMWLCDKDCETVARQTAAYSGEGGVETLLLQYLSLDEGK
jgi:hypothetical protein